MCPSQGPTGPDLCFYLIFLSSLYVDRVVLKTYRPELDLPGQVTAASSVTWESNTFVASSLGPPCTAVQVAHCTRAACLRASSHAVDSCIHYDSFLQVVVKYLVLTKSICYDHFLTGGANVFRKWHPFSFLTEVTCGLAATLLVRVRGDKGVWPSGKVCRFP